MCTPCPLGTYGPNTGMSVCLQCGILNYAPTTGLTSCLQCNGRPTYGTNQDFVSSGASNCLFCPVPSSGTNGMDCLCERGYYSSPSGMTPPGEVTSSCLPCPAQQYYGQPDCPSTTTTTTTMSRSQTTIKTTAAAAGADANVANKGTIMSTGGLAAAIVVPIFTLLMVGIAVYWYFNKRSNIGSTAASAVSGVTANPLAENNRTQLRTF